MTMRMRTHELHPSLVHAPLTLLPAAAVADLIAGFSRRRRNGPGAALWTAGTASGLLAGIAGLAATQEVDADDPQAVQTMWWHGVGNLVLVTTSAGMALWRTRHRPSPSQALLGLAATGLGLFTAYLGGELVYGHGVGVKAVPGAARSRTSPPLFSWAAVPTLLRDAWAGLGWVLGRGREAVRAGRAGRPTPDLGLGAEEQPHL